MEVLTMRAGDGATSLARLFTAKPGGPALLVAPAMGVHARSYDRLGAALARAGVTTLVMELRGSETSSVQPRRGVDYGYAELLDDVRLHVDELERRAGGPVHLLGHSLGSHLGTIGLSRWWKPGARLVVIAGGTVHYRVWSGLERWGVLVGTQLAQLVSRGLGVYPGHRLGFGGRQGASLITEWSNAARTGTFVSRRDGPLEVQLGVLEPEVLAIHVKGDTMAPRPTTEALVGKLTRARVRWLELEPPAEPRKQNPHFRWMKSPEAVAEAVATFLPLPAP